MRTTPLAFTSSTASPSSPIIHSRPIVGVENLVRTMAGIPDTIASTIPPTPTVIGIQDMETPPS